MKIATVGIDLAKNIYSMHGIDEHGKAVLRRTVSRGKLMETMAGIVPFLVGIEACSGAHHWARESYRLGPRLAANRLTPSRQRRLLT